MGSYEDFSVLSTFFHSLSKGSSPAKVPKRRKVSQSPNRPPTPPLSEESEMSSSSQGMGEDTTPSSSTPPSTPTKKRTFDEMMQSVIRAADPTEREADQVSLGALKMVGTTSTKLNYLLRGLLEHQDEKTIVFSQFANSLYHICEALQLAQIKHMVFHSKIVRITYSQFLVILIFNGDFLFLLLFSSRNRPKDHRL